MRFYKLLENLFTPPELVIWLKSVDKQLPNSVNINQAPTIVAFEAAGVLERRGYLKQQKIWQSLADEFPYQADEIWTAAAEHDVQRPSPIPAPALNIDIDDPTAVRTTVENNDVRQLKVLVGQLLDALADRVQSELDPDFIRSLNDQVMARLSEDQNLEQVWSDVGYQPMAWLQSAITRSRCVARIGYDAQSGVGTGFRFDGAWLGAEWTDVALILTNAHVVSDDPIVRASAKSHQRILSPDEAHVTFFGIDGEPAARGRVLRCLWTSAQSALDASLLLVDFPLRDIPPPPRFTGELGSVKRINVIGHPNGGAKNFSLQDNRVDHIRTNLKHIYYRSPTDPGSSGSPLFDNHHWLIVGMHHAAIDSAKHNRGIRLDAIIEAIRGAGIEPPNVNPRSQSARTESIARLSTESASSNTEGHRVDEPAWFEDLPLRFDREQTRRAEQVLSDMLPTEEDVRMAAARAGIPASRLSGRSAYGLLHDLLQKARAADKLKKLLADLLDDKNQAGYHQILRATMLGDEDKLKR